MTLGDLVESYRRKLGLRTWKDQEKWARDLVRARGMTSTGRRSGRTTQKMLTAIAIAVLDGSTVILIQSKTKMTRDHCSWVAKDLMNRLRIDGIRVANWTARRVMTKHVTYIDHHDLEAGPRGAANP